MVFETRITCKHFKEILGSLIRPRATAATGVVVDSLNESLFHEGLNPHLQSYQSTVTVDCGKSFLLL